MSGAIVQGITTLIEIHKINQWAKLIFTVTFSGIVSCIFAMGTALIAHRPTPEAWGEGLVTAAVCMTALYRSPKFSALTKGLTVVLPEAEATTEINTNIQTIERN